MLEAIALGVHLHTFHPWTDDKGFDALKTNDDTPGLYVKGEDWTAGVVRNSLKRVSFYAGYVWTLPTPPKYGQLDLTLGAISGYKYEVMHGPQACSREVSAYHREHYGNLCWVKQGKTKETIMPMVAVSYLAPIEVVGVQPRVSLFGKAVTLSVERKFK